MRRWNGVKGSRLETSNCRDEVYVIPLEGDMYCPIRFYEKRCFVQEEEEKPMWLGLRMEDGYEVDLWLVMLFGCGWET